MKTISYFFGLTLLLTLNACQNDSRSKAEVTEGDDERVNTQQETPVKLIEYLVGDWESTGSGESAQEGPGQSLTFTSEARYIVREGAQRIDSGAYRMNEQLRNLYLESETNGTPREFEIDIRQDAMTLKAKEGGEEYSYRRVSAGAVQPADRL